MVIPISVPKLGMSMSEGVLSEWLVEEGAVVHVGTPLYVIETDKAQTDIESPVAGTVRIIGQEGETYPVGTLVAEIEPALGLGDTP